MSIREMRLKIDRDDWPAIEAAMIRRLSWGIMPDIGHDEQT